MAFWAFAPTYIQWSNLILSPTQLSSTQFSSGLANKKRTENALSAMPKKNSKLKLKLYSSIQPSNHPSIYSSVWAALVKNHYLICYFPLRFILAVRLLIVLLLLPKKMCQCYYLQMLTNICTNYKHWLELYIHIYLCLFGLSIASFIHLNYATKVK